MLLVIIRNDSSLDSDTDNESEQSETDKVVAEQANLKHQFSQVKKHGMYGTMRLKMLQTDKIGQTVKN